jgi:DNA polymerase-1
LAQVPSLRVPYGKDIRELFTVPDGWTMVGCDLSGIELRCLAHYLCPWDDGAYSKLILEADIHTANQEAAGLPDRDAAKKFIYTLVYGGGDQKLGEIIGKGRDAGRQMKNKFFSAMPAFKRLRTTVEATLESRGHLIGLDGRKLYPRSQHSALNTLLQSAGALVAKQWLIYAFDDISNTYKHGWNEQFVFSGWIHDEVQVSCVEEISEDVGNRLRRAAEKAGEKFSFKCRVDAEYGRGISWAATH